MTTNLRITLNANEADALAALACSELRDVRDQIRFIVRNELKRQGLLESEPQSTLKALAITDQGARREPQPA